MNTMEYRALHDRARLMLSRIDTWTVARVERERQEGEIGDSFDQVIHDSRIDMYKQVRTYLERAADTLTHIEQLVERQINQP